METLGNLPRDAESERAAKFYEQALLLVDCCRIPEAIRLLEQAIRISPDSEIYKESLAILQMSYFPSEQQGVSYASVTRPKLDQDDGQDYISSYEWKTETRKTKDNPNKTSWSSTLSSSCHDVGHEQSSIENPWASFVKRNSRRKKSPRSPIDGISEIEIPPGNDDFYSGSPSYQDKENTPISTNNSQKGRHTDERSVGHTQEHCIDGSADFVFNKGNCAENECRNGNGNLDAKFMKEFCMARESATDDWDKYYEVLSGGIGEKETCSDTDTLCQNTTNKVHESSDFLDEIDELDKDKCRNYKGKDHLTERLDGSSSSNVCSKCGLSRESVSPSSSRTKNRIHFVNGVCVSSPSGQTCTCNKQCRGSSQIQSAKDPLSSSQQEFYHNLRQYFGSSKVKTGKAAKEVESDARSSELNQKSSSACSFDTNVSTTAVKNDEPFNAKPKPNVGETAQHSGKGELKSERRNSREHVNNCKVTAADTASESRKAKTSLDSNQMKADKKSSGKEKFQPVDKQKQRSHNKVPSKTKGSTKAEHSKDKVDGESNGDDTQRQHSRANEGVKSKVNHKRGVAEDTPRPAPEPETIKRPNRKQKEKKTSTAVAYCTGLIEAVYQRGLKLASKCLHVSKWIAYYVLFLVCLIITFILFCVWYTASWLVRKVFHFLKVDRLFGAVRGRISPLFEWLRKRRGTQQTTATQGSTYDLPKNGDAAITHMLQNKDSDPYSVLGVPSDASDDDIRRQYRKLAVLIHPDKNPHGQADEAFKILANAFDILSDADKRRDYDREMAWKRREEEWASAGRKEGSSGHPSSPEQFFADLGKKMQEMQNYLHCNQCDGKHRRYSTDRFVLTARYCSRCNTRHAAKEGDLWAESSFLGYKIHFYACMEGEVYDVTDWAACQGLGNYRLEANPHTVHLKLKTRQSYPGGFNSRSEEEDFENFMRAFFGQFNPPREERNQGSNKQPKKRKRKKR